MRQTRPSVHSSPPNGDGGMGAVGNTKGSTVRDEPPKGPQSLKGLYVGKHVPSQAYGACVSPTLSDPKGWGLLSCLQSDLGFSFQWLQLTMYA